MSTLIIPDIHCKSDLAEEIVAKHGSGCERIVFLGDYFDRHRPAAADDAEEAANVARWLARSLEDPRRIHLVGNHDLPYLGNEDCVDNYAVPGWSVEKYEAVRPILDDIDPLKLKISVEIEGWLLSHAGYAEFYAKGRSIQEVVDYASVRYKGALGGERDKFFLPGYARGGGANFGGPTWLDWRHEFNPVPGFNQIVGHTSSPCPRAAILRDVKRPRWVERMEFAKENSETPRRKRGMSVNFCLDTMLTTVAIVDGSEVRLIWL